MCVLLPLPDSPLGDTVQLGVGLHHGDGVVEAHPDLLHKTARRLEEHRTGLAENITIL